MSIRERWVVYPLLFLAILMGARDALVPSSRQSFRSIECQELVVRNINGEPLVHLGESGDQSGMVVVFGPTATTRNLMRADSAEARAPSVPLIEFSGDPDGGALRLRAADHRPAIFLGHWAEDRLSGLLAVSEAVELVPEDPEHGDRPWGLTLPWEDPSSSDDPPGATEASADPSDETHESTEAPTIDQTDR